MHDKDMRHRAALEVLGVVLHAGGGRWDFRWTMHCRIGMCIDGNRERI